MLSFLWSFYTKHKKTLTSILLLLGGLLGIIWTYDIQQLTPTGALTHRDRFQIRLFLTLLSISLYLLSLLITILYHYKKDMDAHDAKKHSFTEITINDNYFKEPV